MSSAITVHTVTIHFGDGGRFFGLLRKRRMPGARTPILAIATTHAYRDAIAATVTADDTVLEVGSAHGVTCEGGSVFMWFGGTSYG